MCSKAVAFVGQAQTVRVAVQQPRLADGFQPRQRARHLAHRPTAFACCGRQRAQLDDAKEQRDVIELQVHRLTLPLFCINCNTDVRSTVFRR